MATVSPTPQAPGLYGQRVLRPSTRQYTSLSRAASQREMPSFKASMQSSNDSSDDELPMPMKLSAVTRALLNKEPSPKATFAQTENSEQHNQQSPVPKRTVRVHATPARAATTSSATKQSSGRTTRSTRTESPRDVSTPAHQPRTVRIPVSSADKRAGSSVERVETEPEYPSTVTRFGTSTLGRSRYGEDAAYQSSMRIKRVGKVSGSFLSGPARRGRRRQSEEDNENVEDPESAEPKSQQDHDSHREYSAGSPRERSPSRQSRPAYRTSTLPSDLPSNNDQENDAPRMDKIEKLPLRPAQRETSPERRALAPRNHNSNTPLRPAPPPPKMTVAETATATGGAATSHSSKKRNNVRVNGKNFTRLDIIGRGGTSRVYRVMAENYKIYALKRVALDDADESTIRGYKGEIDLLRKLKDVDRVVRLIDYENNEDRKTLSVLMEMGELDFHKMLTLRLNADDAKFDPSFTRYYWKEMLECLQAVHEHDIVHSDLKPANFVLVQGRLKLIDFGIANAIQTDETVNVHRDTQVGTPNYMSPESLLDSNQHTDSRGRILQNQPKLVKLGKPSDIWSLGCILYQMVYGRPPFAHIQNQMSRCQAIINFNLPIEYPAKAVGGAWVPSSLIATMKKCLDRDQHKRPTVKQLLSERDPFLYPVEYGEGVVPLTEELLGRILQNVAPKCRDRTPTDAELLSLWPAGYFASIRRNLQEGRL